mmetsp:Transcript_1354/g.4231  ORF Transcript_1354/g.4231 Transcript_1354/m.4231 type:complete len:220 (-) Transcript_1354:385-1044(-)
MLLPVLVRDEVLARGRVVALDLPNVPPPHGGPVHLHLPADGILALGRPVVRAVGRGTRPGVGQKLEPLPLQVQVRLVSVVVLDVVPPRLRRVPVNLALEPLSGLAPVHRNLPAHNLRAEDPLLQGQRARDVLTRLALAARVTGRRRLGLPLGGLLVLLQQLVHHRLVPVAGLHPSQTHLLVLLLLFFFVLHNHGKLHATRREASRLRLRLPKSSSLVSR